MGVDWRSSGDTRVLLLEGQAKAVATPIGSTGISKQELIRLYQKEGDACVDHLVGSFAFALFDADRNRVFAARDLVGSIPLYYKRDKETFHCFSCLNEQFEGSLDESELEESEIARFLSIGYGSSQRTAIKGLNKLPGGHILKADTRGIVISPYWRQQDVPKLTYTSDEAYAEALRELLHKVIRDYTSDSDSWAAHMSGGIDSTTVACIAAKGQAVDNRIGFSWLPEISESSRSDHEYQLVEESAKWCEAKAYYCPARSQDIVEVLRLDYPAQAFDGTLLNEWAVMGLAKERGISRILSGYGGDEAISHSGSTVRIALFKARQWASLFDLIKKGKQNSALSFLKLVARQALEALPERERVFRSSPKWVSPYVSPDIAFDKSQFGKAPPVGASLSDYQAQLIHWGPLQNRIEAWHDIGRRFGLSYTYPLLDRRIIDFALGLPWDQLNDGRQRRKVFRNATKGAIPEIVRTNYDKNDPQRVKETLSSVREGLAEIGHALRTRRTQPRRSGYFDMKRLLVDLEPKALAQRTGFRHIICALAFLDIE
ncbi:asparagine synthase-related protein [Puniceicoccaceae bacterium K14]|nr:asparagine synthase-related protein [Puniceicoccaceae bacterium K14]